MSIVVLIPILGPVFFLFAFHMPDPQQSLLKHDVPKGWYVYKYASLKEILEKKDSDS